MRDISDTLRRTFQRVLRLENRRRVTRQGTLEHLTAGGRNVTVYLPPGYHERADFRYPVLYMQDGQNLFEPERAFVPGQHWRLREAADAAIGERTAAPIIIAGIDHSGDNRIDDYTPTRDVRKKRGGGADAYIRLLLDEIKPAIDERFRTRSGATALGGSSLGALLTLHAGLSQPDVFRRLAIMSPSVWWDNRAILHEVDAYGGAPRPRIWLDIGGREGSEALADVRALRDHLRAHGWSDETLLRYYEDRRADHSERAWAHRVRLVLEFLFPPVAS
jgi:predicted alpha/beta superfamily hydrolase